MVICLLLCLKKENDNNVKYVLLRDILEHGSYLKRFQNYPNDFNQTLKTK